MYELSEKGKSNNVVVFNLADLQADNFNPRKELIERNLEKLRMSEVFAPIIIGKFEDKFYLIDGYHRKFIYDERKTTVADAIIYVYENIWDMKTDAYSMNINHGERLSDEEIAGGIFAKYNYYTSNNIAITYDQLGTEFMMSKRMVHSYVRWGKIKEILTETEISKSKAEVLARFAIEDEAEKAKMIDFWNTHKRLPVHELRKAYDLFINGKDYYQESLKLTQNINAANYSQNTTPAPIVPATAPVNNATAPTFGDAPLPTNTQGIDANGVQTILVGEQNLTELQENLSKVGPTKTTMKAIFKNLIKTLSDTYASLEHLDKNGQIEYYAEHKKHAHELQVIIDNITAMADDGWVAESVSKAEAEEAAKEQNAGV